MPIDRDIAPELRRAAEVFPVVTVTGPRQSGKSTLCRQTFAALPVVNLEAPDIRQSVAEDPRRFLADHPDGAILDEFQRVPELPSYLQVEVDQDPRPGRWILTGSRHLTLLANVGQSLAGRSAILSLLPLHRGEVRRFPEYPQTLDEALLAGGFPRIFDAGIEPSRWFESYVSTYLERDVRALSNIGDLAAFQRFIQLCAGRTAQVLNLSALAADAGVSQPSAKHWLSVLEACFLVLRLPPFFRNLGKRLVKSPKLHLVDSGLTCWLLGIRTVEQLRTHPLRGSIFESWVVSEILKHRLARGESRGLTYYREQGALEADLVIEDGGRLTIVEVKAGATATSDMLTAARRVADRVHDRDPDRPPDSQRSGDISVLAVYGGDRSMPSGDATILAWEDLDNRRW